MHRLKGLFFTMGLVLLVGGLSGFAKAKVDLSDVGEVSLANSGKAEAQQAFLHGLAQMHNFEYRFAAEDFKKAQEIDPDFALAYWGEAMTHNHPIWMEQDRDAALAALGKFAATPQERAAKTPEGLERDLMIAADILYGEGTKEDRDDLYSAYLGELHARYPDNVDVAAFYALSIMGTAHEGRDFATYMKSAAISERFIQEYPKHPGLAHYLIHATDDPVHAPLGLDAANAYGAIAPNAAHAQHMTTHIFLALGDWDGVIRANVRAGEIVDAMLAKRDMGPAGCGHYTSWLMYGYLQIGERDKAHDIMTLCNKNAADQPVRYNLGYFAWQRSLYLIDSGEWDGDVAAMAPDYGDNHGGRFEQEIMDGWAAAKTGKTGLAEDALKAAKASFAALKAKSEDDGETDAEEEKQSEVELLQLEGLIALRKGRERKALTLMREAVALEMDMPFGFGPPQPAKPSLELLGETLVELGKMEEARSVLEQSLLRTPNRRLTLEALAAANRTEEVSE